MPANTKFKFIEMYKINQVRTAATSDHILI